MSIKPDDGLLYSAPHILSMTYFVPVYLVHRIEAAGCIPPPRYAPESALHNMAASSRI